MSQTPMKWKWGERGGGRGEGGEGREEKMMTERGWGEEKGEREDNNHVMRLGVSHWSKCMKSIFSWHVFLQQEENWNGITRAREWGQWSMYWDYSYKHNQNMLAQSAKMYIFQGVNEWVCNVKVIMCTTITQTSGAVLIIGYANNNFLLIIINN